MSANLSAILYLISGVLFILALRGLSSPETSRQGNLFGIIGMIIAVTVTFLSVGNFTSGFIYVLIFLAIGGSIGAIGGPLGIALGTTIGGILGQQLGELVSSRQVGTVGATGLPAEPASILTTVERGERVLNAQETAAVNNSAPDPRISKLVEANEQMVKQLGMLVQIGAKTDLQHVLNSGVLNRSSTT